MHRVWRIKIQRWKLVGQALQIVNCVIMDRQHVETAGLLYDLRHPLDLLQPVLEFLHVSGLGAVQRDDLSFGGKGASHVVSFGVALGLPADLWERPGRHFVSGFQVLGGLVELLKVEIGQFRRNSLVLLLCRALCCVSAYPDFPSFLVNCWFGLYGWLFVQKL